eukprot:CAMPEP_0175987000 /NCGR_PEP_ID=MMETSP0108-20121206/50459_1 /TAXON_ID=195067 ORGANISM="Goniomonas pacifica, Strain CCMP1869" /NCGR_SAMPLE_ID=MMETSP0108 /ASSEMBLY_ACC=CAM_ASM_000204 /LENGTH=34 /DNA_ID= /DNA_START= /DNA_END= /DNA_ORIENTATION=
MVPVWDQKNERVQRTAGSHIFEQACAKVHTKLIR